ncbi:MAG: hypothetical protein HFI93_07620 [Lachnospiraceae bacterium]|nr:hypothetical protein [Lachnospiraceae bacterium]
MSREGTGNREKRRARPATAFYMETLMLAAVFVTVILVLVRVFALSGQMSGRARVLTCAVHLAENAAEAAAAAQSPEALREILEENGNVRWEENGEEGLLCAWYADDMSPAPEGDFRVDVTWTSEESAVGGLHRSTITVYWAEEAVYTLKTARWQEVTP